MEYATKQELESVLVLLQEEINELHNKLVDTNTTLNKLRVHYENTFKM